LSSFSYPPHLRSFPTLLCSFVFFPIIITPVQFFASANFLLRLRRRLDCPLICSSVLSLWLFYSRPPQLNHFPLCLFSKPLRSIPSIPPGAPPVPLYLTAFFLSEPVGVCPPSFPRSSLETLIFYNVERPPSFAFPGRVPKQATFLFVFCFFFF